ncbi:hypothetical protein [Streptomyces sp. HUAS ZL42]|uniref:hypothetical protein n=1 Tax=Streptomyces sp. HUAS ZL42 TaxID=3231715 RepID=UPI00345E452B
MSTEARRASIPPRPGTPPRPTQPPTNAGRPAPEAPRTPEDPPAAPPTGADPAGTPTPPRGPRTPADTRGALPGTRSAPRTRAWSPWDRPDVGAVFSAGRDTDEAGSGDRDSGAARSESGSSSSAPRFPSPRATPPRPAAPTTPPPPPASARFPDAPPTTGHDDGEVRREGATTPESATEGAKVRGNAGAGPSGIAGKPVAGGIPPRPFHRPGVPTRPAGAPVETTSETTARLRPVPKDPTAEPDTGGAAFAPDPALSWSAMTPGGSLGAGRPVVHLGEPEVYDDRARPRPLGGRLRARTAVAAACAVLGLGLIGGAVTGSWLVGDSGEGAEQSAYTAAGSLWHSVPVDRLFPPTVDGQGAGPGGADRTWTRIAVAPDAGCTNAFDPLLRQVLAPVGCDRLLRATYTDATQSYVTTVGMLFTTADAAGMRSLAARFEKEGLASRTDLMPRPYAAKDTVAAAFGDKQRASWSISVLTDAPVVVYAVSGWADGRTVDIPQPAEQATQSGATTAPGQAGLGNEAQGLADRIERSLRRTATSPTEQPS